MHCGRECQLFFTFLDQKKLCSRGPTTKATATSFIAEEFNGQVQEIVEKIAPSIEGDIIVRNWFVQPALRNVFPGAEVAGYASGDVTRGSAFGVAIPAIDLVLNVIPSESAQMLQNRARDCFLDP